MSVALLLFLKQHVLQCRVVLINSLAIEPLNREKAAFLDRLVSFNNV